MDHSARQGRNSRRKSDSLFIISGVPLSDHEQRILDEIEKGLYQEDPDFARTKRRRTDDVRNIRWGALLFLMGFGLLLGFFVTGSVFVGVSAFAGMVGGIVLVAGGVRTLWSNKTAARQPRRGVKDALLEWEERLRERYKKP